MSGASHAEPRAGEIRLSAVHHLQHQKCNGTFSIARFRSRKEISLGHLLFGGAEGSER